ncbi:OmpA family protein [Lysobacter firmicutimachus]|uniref:OmpA family protein n=4 Tax=Lysobacter TaxID=68 RepID=A0ABU8CYG6_9GAMM
MIAKFQALATAVSRRLIMPAAVVATLLFSSGPVAAQTASNTATVQPPSGVTDPTCNVANPPCNSAIDSDSILPTLTLVKTVTNDNGGTAVATAWTLQAAGPTNISGATGATAVTNAPVQPGAYTLSETGGPSGYTAGTYSCVVNGGAPVSSNSLTLAFGDVATCTINNDDQAATLTLVKTVTNDNGGTATINDFPLTATGPTTITGVSGTATVTNAPVSAGVYTLTEASVAGYTAGSWSCTAGTLSGNSLTLANGESATCTIVNDDQAATLTLVKTVTNDNGGTATINDFPLTATGPTTITGVSGTATVTNAPVSAGVYTLTEASVAGYTAGAWSCTAGTLSGNSLTLANGESATCTIVNDDQAATLTLVKTVTNDNGGTATINDFPLTATGPTTITGVSGTATVTNAPVSAGVYTLTEASVAGYTAGSWSCTAGTLSGNSLTLANGESATCTIVNDDQAATLTLVKTVTNDNGGTATISDFPLTATGPTTITGVSGTATVTNAPVSAGVYTLTEASVAGYTAGSWSCTAGTLSGNSLTLANGESATCTIVNDDQAATLTLVKTVTNDNGGTATINDFPLTATGPTTITGVSGTATVTNAPVSAGVYTLTEASVAGYTAGAWSCTAGTLSGNSLTLANGESATCTIVNDDQAATLTLVKTVTNDNGGTATINDFPLTATGPTTITGVSGTATVTNAPVSAGVYTLTEASVAGYTAGSWSCTAGTLSGNSLTLANGESATCTIVNDDQAATLTLVKTVTNDNGGTATISDFPLTATGPTTITGVSGTAAVTNAPVSAGVYTLTEASVAGYTAGSWSCTAGTLSGNSLTLANGESATCTIVNDDQAATLTLVKTVTNDNGGTATISDFPLTATGPTTITGVSGTATVTNAPVSAGVYTLTEASVAGYTAGSWSCTAGTLSGNSLTLANGESATCTIVNDDQAATLTLVKTVTNDNGGTAMINDFPLTATGPTTITGVSGTATVTNAPVSAGVYTLTEASVAGYTAGAWSCTAGTLSGNSLTLANGESATCTIVNDDQAATLTLVKTVTNDNGGTATISDFPLTATGPTTITGVSGTAAVTNAPVSAGVYTLTEASVAGYTAGSWSCTAGTLSGNSLTLANGESATCTIVNDDQAATLTLVKTVTNDNGGTATINDFPLTATGPTTITGVSGTATVTNAPVSAGVYTLTEASVAGYTAGSWSCTAGTLSGNSLTLANGESATCTIVNDDQAATLTLVKTVTNDNGGTATINDFPLTATGPTTITGVSGTATVTNAPVSAGVYTLTEASVAGYTAGSWSCTAGTLSGNSLTLANGESATCTIVNDDQAATLTLVKTVTNDNGGTATINDFPLTATGPTTITGVSGTATVTNAPVSAGVYTLTEASVAGYTAGAWSCTAGTLSGNSLTLANGESATCTIVNDDQAATLTLVKTVTNDNGGTATISDFPLTATGPTTITGVSGTATVTNAPVSAGVYTLTEASVAGYTAGSWSCTAGTLSGNSLTLANGESATCTIVNDDQAATLTLVKTVTNDNGGTATINDFPLTATGPTTITGVSGTATVTNAPVSAGVYTLTEASVAGYTAGAWSCTAGTLSGNSLTLANGESATCTIVNDDQAATLTLVKTVTNDNGGTATINDFPLTATGPTTITGVSGTATVTNAPVSAGVYTLTEASVAGYTAGSWSCTAGTLSGNSLTLANGESATCTIVNDDQAATLTLVKTVTNDNGGTATISDFPLTATGPTTITGVSGTATVTNAPVSAGVYTLTEASVAGYTAGSWSCTAGTLSGNSLTLANGESATCTIVNDDQAATLTLVKTVTNDNGGTATINDFPLTATGPTTITGVSGTATVTNAPVSAGVYTLTEASVAGYTAGSWSCTAGTLSGNSLTLANGESATCTIVNDDQAATLTLVKTVTNDNGGTATISDFPLTATGPTTITGVSGTAAVTNAPVSAGVYTLTEASVAGYTAGSWSCTAGTLSGNSLTLANGESATCTIVNDDQAATLTLVKTVTNDNGGTATISDFPLTATGPTTITGVSGTAAVTNAPVSAGVYTLTEASVAGYTAGSWSCTAGTLSGNSLTLANGESATCTIVNDDQAATLTLVKVVSGGSATATDWTLSATGPTTISGAGGATGAVDAGTYVLAEAGGPANVTYTAGTWSCTGGTLSGNDLTLAIGETATCSITNTYVPPAVTVNKTSTPAGPVAVGDTITYTLTTVVSNSQTTGVTTLTDTLGTGLTFGAVTNAGIYTCSSSGANNVTCTLPANTAPGSYAVSYTATVNASATGSVGNTVVPTGPDNPGCGTCTTNTPVTPSAVTVNKTSTPAGPVAVGDTITYTLTTVVSNSQTTGVTTLTDTLGTGLTFGAVTNAGIYTCSSSGANNVTCILPANTAPGSYAVSYTATVNASATGSVGNTVVPTGPDNPGCGTCTTNTPVTPSAVTVNKTSTPAGPVAVGDTITYTLTTVVSNSQTTGVTTLTDTLGTGLTFGAVTNAGIYTCSSSGANNVTCTLPANTAPGSYAVSYTATVNASATGSVGNTVVPTGPDNPGCGTCTTNTPVAAPAVSYTKTASTAGPVVVGDTITYTLTAVVTNSQLTTDLVLTDTLGTGLTFGAVTSAGSYSCNGANPLVCTLPTGTLPGTYAVSYTASVNAQATGSVNNAVTANQGTCTTTPCGTETPVATPAVTYEKTVSTAGPVVVGDTLTYTLTVTISNAQTTDVTTLTDTMGSGLDFVAVTNAGPFTCNAANPLVCTLPSGTVPGSYAMSYTARVNGQAGGTVNNAVVGTGTDAPSCSTVGCATVTEVAPPVVTYNKTASTQGPVAEGDTITYTLTTTVGNAPTRNALTLTDTLGSGLDFVAVTGGNGYTCNAANPLVCTLPAGTVPGNYTVTYTARVNAQASETVDNTVVGTGTDNPTCQGSCTTSTTVAPPPTLRVIKQASPRDVKIGDLVRYTVTVENTGTVDATDATLVDTPPAGFSFVDGSLSVADRDGAGRLVGTYPIQVDQVDIAAGERATFTYLLRVGAGVRPGIHTNHALMRDNGKVVSNVATAEVQLIADPLLDESLILGTVFDDRDGDGWQDSAAMDGIKVQGGFAPEAYVPNSTTVDRGAGPTPEPDASSPMLHGIALGSIAGRQSDADPVSAHTVVIRQRLNALSFNDEFTLTTQQGVTVRMDAAGATRIERSGDAAKNLTAAAPTVERRVSQGEGGYVVDYVVSNTGVDERGIPGVRIASVEGLLMETDQFGRYHLEGVDVGTLERGRNFILKVDPATLPPGSVFTTDNPLVRRVTPGLPVRFDWGVKLPAGLIEGGQEQVEMELGEVFFAPGSAEVRAQYLPAVEKMAEQVKRHRGGEVVIVANGDTQSLAFDRASAVKDALIKQLPADAAQALKVSVRGDADDPGSLIVGLGEGGALLGTVLFDTDKSTIKPQFEPLLDKVAKALDSMKGGVIAIVGHTDVRASYEYNTALGMRRAKAVYEALAQRLSPEVRAKVRVESSNDPTAPVGVKRN